MSKAKKPRAPREFNLPHVLSQLHMAKHWMQQSMLPAQQAIARIEDVEREIQAYAAALAPVVTEEDDELEDQNTTTAGTPGREAAP